jgi:hypothetical protein
VFLGNALLGLTVGSPDYEALPKGNSLPPRHGYDAHHVVPTGLYSGIRNSPEQAAQKYAYTCDIQANTAVNGIWLRGSVLKDFPFNPVADANELQRPTHARIHTAEYLTWVKNSLAPFATEDGTCTNRDAMQTALRQIKAALRAGTATF